MTVKGDADRIEQIADNLLSNAVKFTPAGRVEFAVSHGKGGLRMVVSDTGIGMAQADIKRIFQPFERAAQHIDTEGFGLGLPITRSLVKLLGGSIRVESEPGRGSRFTVCLPLETTDEAVTRQEVTSASALPAHLRIAAIDDDPMQLRIVREMLERNGAHCDTCTHVRELMEKIRQTDYDLLLTDIQMRDTGGFDLLRLLRSARIGQLARGAGVGDDGTGGHTPGGAGPCGFRRLHLQAVLHDGAVAGGRQPCGTQGQGYGPGGRACGPLPADSGREQP